MLKMLRVMPGAAYGAAMKRLEQLRAALCDRARREWAVVALLAAYAAIWTLYDILSRRGEDIHYDMGEMVAWLRDLALGSPKHPQLGAWVAGAWFLIFPEKDWAFYLLANSLIAFSLWIAWRLSEHRLNDNKRVAGLVFLTVIPFFNFFAWKYNANTILIPLWAATTFLFFRSLETKSKIMAALTGVAAAAAMMGKYWSIFLLAGLGIAALISPHRRSYFRSAAPWITILAGTLALAPHVHWVFTHQFSPFVFAVKGHPAKTSSEALIDAGLYVSGFAAYLALPLLLLMLLARPGFAALADIIWPHDRARRFMAAAFWLPISLPIPVALLNNTRLASIWTMSACVLAPIVFLSSPRIKISSAVARQLLAAAIIFSLSALVMAPARALRIREVGALNLGAEYKPIAHAVEKEWRKTNNTKLTIVGSYANLVNGVSFYMQDRPSVLNVEGAGITPWIGPERIRQEGIAIVCPIERESCIQAAETIARNWPSAKRVERAIARHYRGAASKAKRYLIITIPPGLAAG